MGQIVNPVDKGDFVLVSFDSNVFAVNNQYPREPERTAEGFGESGIIRELLNLPPDL